MKVRFRTTYAGPDGTFPAGLITDLEPEIATRLHTAGALVPVEPADLARLESRTAAAKQRKSA